MEENKKWSFLFFGITEPREGLLPLSWEFRIIENLVCVAVLLLLDFAFYD